MVHLSSKYLDSLAASLKLYAAPDGPISMCLNFYVVITAHFFTRS